MPLRLNSFPLATVRHQRLFHASCPRRADDSPNHYETLQIPVNATPAELSQLERSFYHLSKTHHPDRNPDDPSASERFVRISDAYAVLGTPYKRAAYDREHIHMRSQAAASSRPSGSYSSTSPAGGRSPSGLSKRRTAFRGPPPSFYRSGGWGSQSAKRSSAQSGAEPRDNSDAPSYSGSGTYSAGGMGPGQSPFGFGEQNDVPHFNREGHFRTHEDMRRRREKTGEGWNAVGHEPPTGLLGSFLWVSGLLAVGVSIPVWLYERRQRRVKIEKGHERKG